MNRHSARPILFLTIILLLAGCTANVSDEIHAAPAAPTAIPAKVSAVDNGAAETLRGGNTAAHPTANGTDNASNAATDPRGNDARPVGFDPAHDLQPISGAEAQALLTASLNTWLEQEADNISRINADGATWQAQQEAARDARILEMAREADAAWFARIDAEAAQVANMTASGDQAAPTSTTSP